MHFLVRTSTIFGADVNDPKGCRKTLCKKKFALIFLAPNISGPQKGPVEKGPRQKTSKIAKKCQDKFRHFWTIFAQGKKRRKASKIFATLFDKFRAAPIFRPLLGGGSDNKSPEVSGKSQGERKSRKQPPMSPKQDMFPLLGAEVAGPQCGACHVPAHAQI